MPAQTPEWVTIGQKKQNILGTLIGFGLIVLGLGVIVAGIFDEVNAINGILLGTITITIGLLVVTSRLSVNKKLVQVNVQKEELKQGSTIYRIPAATRLGWVSIEQDGSYLTGVTIEFGEANILLPLESDVVEVETNLDTVKELLTLTKVTYSNHEEAYVTTEEAIRLLNGESFDVV